MAKYKKQILLIGCSLLILAICIILIFYFHQNILVPVNTSDTVIPNVTKENTVFQVSETKKTVEKVTISVADQLDNFQLYYYLQTNSNQNAPASSQDYALFDKELTLDENATVFFKYGASGHYSEENYTLSVSNIAIPEIATSESASKEELKKEKVNKKDIKKVSTSPYYIKVNYKANTVTVYKKDKNNKYTVPVKAIVCSTGTATPTSGVYRTSNKYRWGKLIHNSYGQYSTRIVGSILFHSVPYYAPRNDALFYQQYDKLGTKASAGCIRLTTIDAKWIYENCPSGTMVEFYASSNPGPLGKPTAQKISSVKECRDWDPTDPKKGNPWHTYKPKKEENKNNLANNLTNNFANTNNTTNQTPNEVTNHVTGNNTNTGGNTAQPPSVNNSVFPTNNQVTNSTSSTNSTNSLF